MSGQWLQELGSEPVGLNVYAEALDLVCFLDAVFFAAGRLLR